MASSEPTDAVEQISRLAHLDICSDEARAWLEQTADVELHTSDSESIPAHGSSLIQWSKVLGECVTATVPTTSPDKHPQRIPIDLTMPVLVDMMRLLYSGDCPEQLRKLKSDQQRFREVMQAAHKYDAAQAPRRELEGLDDTNDTERLPYLQCLKKTEDTSRRWLPLSTPTISRRLAAWITWTASLARARRGCSKVPILRFAQTLAKALQLMGHS
ncbi:hypothetical protein WJX73_000884 [Symbiochloris irregularis]|uniref:BTB domain-containing protein n=1 Tax=Symbiochloris irregularis TaxID=706552 RepID=A0AAW1PSM3_9CHLO